MYYRKQNCAVCGSTVYYDEQDCALVCNCGSAPLKRPLTQDKLQEGFTLVPNRSKGKCDICKREKSVLDLDVIQQEAFVDDVKQVCDECLRKNILKELT